MRAGVHLRELWTVRVGVLLAAVIALFVTLPMNFDVSPTKLRFTPRSLQIGSASTRVMVDTPKSMVLDLSQGPYAIDGLTHRAVLLGNVMASLPVREYIGRRARLPAAAINMTTPTTPA